MRQSIRSKVVIWRLQGVISDTHASYMKQQREHSSNVNSRRNNEDNHQDNMHRERNKTTGIIALPYAEALPKP